MTNQPTGDLTNGINDDQRQFSDLWKGVRPEALVLSLKQSHKEFILPSGTFADRLPCFSCRVLDSARTIYKGDLKNWQRNVVAKEAPSQRWVSQWGWINGIAHHHHHHHSKSKELHN
ncbi:hypothetical protein KIN20_033716 [Parelaphostrongylus tenuis]|uniref:Uncharacterized protein n=1 Tax=Parelaphostrongylus tenuis TaxID=148309 RepID=A0AAD5WJ49_PARTN|nr:hypothetical protein KIN20_033716 [Parelaphostrongylus tenuis]